MYYKITGCIDIIAENLEEAKNEFESIPSMDYLFYHSNNMDTNLKYIEEEESEV